MQKTEQQKFDEMIILDFVRCGIVRANQYPHEWTINRAHHLVNPPSDPDGSISASLSYETRCAGYAIWLRAALEELFLAMDKYNKTYKGYKNRNKYFNKGATLAFKSFKRLAYCGARGLMDHPRRAHSIRMRIVGDMCEIEWLLREYCGFEGMLEWGGTCYGQLTTDYNHYCGVAISKDLTLWCDRSGLHKLILQNFMETMYVPPIHH